jgi:transglutaminase-like putative cysteine protease
MLIRSEFDIQFFLPQTLPMVAILRLHPSLDPLMRAPEELLIEHLDSGGTSVVPVEEYVDSFGNRCSRFVAPQGALRVTGSSLVENDGRPDAICNEAEQHAVEELPAEILQFLLSSRYCQVDQMAQVAGDMFGHTLPGWGRAVWIRDWVHNHVRFDYSTARPTKTALDVFTERVGVCRDFQHLAVTMTRAMNIPARYVTGYLGDICSPYSGAGDFSAWYQVYLGGRWWTMDARHNEPRVGRVLMATGRDATDVAITTSFGAANVTNFYVESFEVDEQGETVPLMGGGVRDKKWVPNTVTTVQAG